MRFTSANAAPQNCYDDSCRIIRRYEVKTSIENRFSKGACVQDGKGRLRRTKHSAALEFVDRQNRNTNSTGTLGWLLAALQSIDKPLDGLTSDWRHENGGGEKAALDPALPGLWRRNFQPGPERKEWCRRGAQEQRFGVLGYGRSPDDRRSRCKREPWKIFATPECNWRRDSGRPSRFSQKPRREPLAAKPCRQP